MEKIIKKSKKLIVILGPTATGKTRLAVAVAKKFNGEIVSADSRQVFRGMDIGTGKDLAEYNYELRTLPTCLPDRQAGRQVKNYELKTKKIPYHLIDIVSPKTSFNVAKFQRLANRAIADILHRGKVPLLVGGTGLYIDAVVKGYNFAITQNKLRTLPTCLPDRQAGRQVKNYELRNNFNKLSLPELLARLEKIDPETFEIIDQKNRRRVQRALETYYETGLKKSEQKKSVSPDFDILLLGVKFPLEKIYAKIDKRLEERLKEGMIEEIAGLHKKGVSWKRLDEFGLEYRFVSRYLRGLISEKEMKEQLKNAIHHFAKRQLTWFKRHPEIVWIGDYKTAEKRAKEFLD